MAVTMVALRVLLIPEIREEVVQAPTRAARLRVAVPVVVAAAEAAVGLAIILTVFKNRQSLEIDEVDSLRN